MDLAGLTAHRALAYVSALQRQSYSPTIAEFKAYAEQPQQRPPTIVRRSKLMRQLAPMFSPAFVEWLEPEIEVREEGESVLDWLKRIKWLRVVGGRVRITPLGEAILAHAEQEAMETEAPLDIALDQDDPLAKARLLGKIHELGKCDLVDAYFRMDDVLPILNHTGVERILTHPPRGGDKKRLVELQAALGALTPERPFEIRASDEFHDRYVIPEKGVVWQIGTSLGGVGHRFSAMVKVQDDKLASHIRGRFESCWKKASPLTPAEATPAPKAKGAAQSTPRRSSGGSTSKGTRRTRRAK